MANYGYRCPWCGPFEQRANPRAAGALVACPWCGALSARTYSAPGGRGARRDRQLDGVVRSGRERIERAEQGVPSAGAIPDGRHLHGGGGAARGRAGRPWQVGH